MKTKFKFLPILICALCAFAPLRSHAQTNTSTNSTVAAPVIPAGPINFNFLTNLPTQGDLRPRPASPLASC